MRLIHGDAIKELQKLIDEGIQVDLTVTSPPYDNLRTYEDKLEWNENIWKKIISLLYNITKDGGVVVWVVGDATIKGSETGTSFKQALYAMECGFNLHDTMIYEKSNPMPKNDKRYEPAFEYMFIFVKGKLNKWNPIKEKAKMFGKINSGTQYDIQGNLKEKWGSGKPIKEYKVKSNIWKYPVGRSYNGHPAIFPLRLAQDHIISWSNEGNTVLDPFMGSGTTGVACKNTEREFIGIEKIEKYYNIAYNRIKNTINRLV